MLELGPHGGTAGGAGMAQLDHKTSSSSSSHVGTGGGGGGTGEESSAGDSVTAAAGMEVEVRGLGVHAERTYGPFTLP